ncbi:MAG: endolytic transglycosylase MltG [Candidatus Campbellbacteria bacterium]|nr:endolytic transglycosylase MltG [Candidatus Campbellbacteria bacterium]
MVFSRVVAVLVIVFVFTALTVSAIFWLSITPKATDEPVKVEIERGSTLSDSAQKLKEAGIIKSALAFQTYFLFKEDESKIVAGEYRFLGTSTVEEIATRLTEGDFENGSLGISIPEGSTIQEIAAILNNELSSFDKEDFLKKASLFEGYLFPDTYIFHKDVTSEEVIRKMYSNFQNKVESIVTEDALEDHSLNEIITMASILEEEAGNMDSRQIISGILWKRLEKGMPLQVDAAFLYVDELDGKNTYSLTTEDLAIESPYNTYTNTGLPPTPITNPGLESIRAAANPIDSEYIFYLSDTQGNTYYAETFEEHIDNRQFLGS